MHSQCSEESFFSLEQWFLTGEKHAYLMSGGLETKDNYLREV